MRVEKAEMNSGTKEHRTHQELILGNGGLQAMEVVRVGTGQSQRWTHRDFMKNLEKDGK